MSIGAVLVSSENHGRDTRLCDCHIATWARRSSLGHLTVNSPWTDAVFLVSDTLSKRPILFHCTNGGGQTYQLHRFLGDACVPILPYDA